jgi:crossover junction endodeoxyribonuclease RuvC
MIVVGVDPGISGALAVVEVADGAAPVLVGCSDIPVIGTGAKERVDVAAIRNFIDRHKPIRALIERAQAMPKQGASSGFKYGRAVAIEAAITLCSIALIALYGASTCTRAYDEAPDPTPTLEAALIAGAQQ